MTVWQKIAGFATALGDAGGSLLHGLADAFGFDRHSATAKERRLHDRRRSPSAPRWPRPTAWSRRWRWTRSAAVFRFSPEEAANVERVFNLAKQDVAGYEAYADQIAALLEDDRKLLQHVLEGLMYVAAADGVLHPKEDDFLKSVAHTLRLFRQRVPLFPRPLRA